MSTKNKTGYILGKRIYGDIEPNYDPLNNRPARILLGQKLTNVIQDYDQTSITQNFAVGAALAVDERVFHYSRAVAALVNPCTYRLCVSTDQILALNDMLAPAISAVNSTTISVTIGAFQAGVVAANELAGGWAEMWPAAGGFMFRRIIANTVVAAGVVTLTLDRPIDIAIAIGDLITIHPNVYRRVDNTTAAGLNPFAAAIGVPPVPVAINRYFWLQTWGPCFIAPTGAWPLSVANDYDVYFHSADGTTASFNVEYAAGANIGVQRVGHVMGSGAYGSGAVFLELDPL